MAVEGEEGREGGRYSRGDGGQGAFDGRFLVGGDGAGGAVDACEEAGAWRGGMDPPPRAPRECPIPLSLGEGGGMGVRGVWE